jgi:hypothetical protein
MRRAPKAPPRLRDSGLRWVVATAAYYGGHGFHVLDSERTLSGVQQWDIVIPDWYFWFEATEDHPGCAFWRELKVERMNPRPQQRVIIASLRAAGEDVEVWRPSNELAIIETFRRAAGLIH